MLITHDMGVVATVCSKVIIMYGGLVMESGTVEEVFYEPKHPYTKALLNAIPIASLKYRKKLEIIKGEVTSPINPKPGCRFADRCPYATDRCREDGLKLKEITPGHFVACRLHE